MRVRFQSEMYRVTESSGETTVRLLLLGDTSNTVSVTLQTVDQDAVGMHMQLDNDIVLVLKRYTKTYTVYT